MDYQEGISNDESKEFRYLCVDNFISTLVDAQALAAAFELRIIDHLIAHGSCMQGALQSRVKGDIRGLALLLGMLKGNKVLEEENGVIKLTSRFTEALKYRDLLEAKLDFANFAARDFLDFFTLLIQNPAEFMRRSEMFRLFSYGRCFEYSEENYEQTKRWMRFTTSLTKHEAHVCMKYHDFSCYRRMLDIGGNSGEFALQTCKTHPGLNATVFDLPLVCVIGEEHIEKEPESRRISFIKGDALKDQLPDGFDIVTFKSMLHDWPNREAVELLAKASDSLAPGGTLLIFERGPFETRENTLSYSVIPFLLFFNAFRSPDAYANLLGKLGFTDVSVKRVDLEMPFYLTCGIKKS